MVKLISGKVKKTPPSQVSSDRFNFLSLAEAEPDLGVPPSSNYVLTSDTSGNRTWVAQSGVVASYNAASANYLVTQGTYAATAVGNTRGPAGLSLREVYVNGYPTDYGNVVHVNGSGAGQLLIGWSGSDGVHADNYIRSKRDNDFGAWSSWAKIITDVNYNSYAPSLTGTGASGTWNISINGNAYTASKLANVRYINGVGFDGQSDITINAVDATPRIAVSEKGVANGVATLGADGKVPAIQLPSYVDDVLEYANTGAFPGTGETGKIYVALDTNKAYRWSGSVYVYITSGAVDSVAGKTGVVTLVKADVGLSNVDNTADSVKYVANSVTTDQRIFNQITIGTRVSSGAYGGNTSGIANTAFPGEIRANGARPALTWHYENVATRHIALDADGALTVLNPSEGGVGAALRSNRYYFSTNNSYLSEGYSLSVQITNDHGWLQIGPRNTGHCHFITDRSNFYFGSQIYVNGEVYRYSDSALHLHTSNYTSYVPTLTGTGASGVWNISINGYATDLGFSGTNNNLNTHFSETSASRFRINECIGASNAPAAEWGFVQSIRHSNSSSLWGVQNYYAWTGSGQGRVYHRLIQDGAYGSWYEHITTLNYTDQSVTGKLLTGLNVAAGSVTASDTILSAIGKLTATVTSVAGGAITTVYGTSPIEVTGGTTPTVSLNIPKLFNNSSVPHSTHQDFNSVDIGVRFLQGNSNSPKSGGAYQWYGFTLGLGSEYGINNYGSQLYWQRQDSGNNPDSYIYIRDKEAGAWGSWRKVWAGSVTHYHSRSDSTAYPILWGVAGEATPVHSCSAVTITSSTGTINANGFVGYGAEGREVRTYIPSSYTTGAVVSGIEFKWYSDVWRVGAARSGGTPIENLHFQLNGTDKAVLATNGDLTIPGTLYAASKSFLIPHPLYPIDSGKKLRHGSLEGPENAVYVRGRTKTGIITLPDYWAKLVDQESITVNLTPIGKHQNLYVESVSISEITVKNESFFTSAVDCYYTVYAERIDVEKMVVEL